MDGWMDSMLIAISPKPLGRRITKFNKRSWWYSYINLDAFFLLLYEISKSVTLTSRSYPGMGMMLSKTLDLYLPTCKINEIPQESWWYSYINITQKFWHMKIVRDLDPKIIPWDRVGAVKNLSPISTTRPNMNEIHLKVFIIKCLINFNVKTLTLRQK